MWFRQYLESRVIPMLKKRRVSAIAPTQLIAAVATGAAVSGTTVFCRPLKTPEYLIPYYLRSSRSRFNHFASVKSGKKGSKQRYLSTEDFIRCVLVRENTDCIPKHVVDAFQKVLNVVDGDSDGKISFTEYTVIMALLVTPQHKFELLFHMMDDRRGGGNRVDAESFATMLESLCPPEVNVRTKTPMFKALFGPKLQGLVSAADLKVFVDQLRDGIWTAEFAQYDPKGVGTITAEDFGRLFARQLVGLHLPIHMVQNLRRMRDMDCKVPLNVWLEFQRVMVRSDELSEAVRMFISSGQELKRRDFINASKAAGIEQMPTQVVDLLYAVFDKNGDETLEFDEFFSIAQERLRFNVKEVPREKAHLVTRLAKCTREAADLAQTEY